MPLLRMIRNDEAARLKPPLVRRERVVGEGVNIRRICRPQSELVRVVIDFPLLNIARNVEMQCRHNQNDCGQHPERRQNTFLPRIQIAMHLNP